MGLEHIRNIIELDGARITAIADNHPQSLSACLQMLRAINSELAESLQVFDSAMALFRENICDVMIVATPNHTHHEVLMSAFKYASSRVHILVEKPLCTTVEDCRDVIQKSKDRQGLLYVGLEYAYMPPIARLIADTKANLIGESFMGFFISVHEIPCC